MRPEGLPVGLWVVDAYPGALLRALQQRGGIPPAVRDVVTAELAHHTPESLRLRIERRWNARYWQLTGPEIAQRCDELAVALIEGGPCAGRCEDGWLYDADRSCPLCAPGNTVVNTTGPDVNGNGRADPDAVRELVAGLRADIRAKHGVPRGGWGGYRMKRTPEPYVPPPFTLREPEPRQWTPEEIDAAKEAARRLNVQRMAEQRAKADKAARKKSNG